ncbi:pyruvate, phosphate dikinase [Desulfurobacterium thermolithotrophum DSM 11699]|uniref:Pyruvate, phosphate dikinase n=1 Tax=Desulfurobacterium thermolithotrophum (strain DSM 11699 / BSA) TaxID=868864 RepID=F0S1L2_DESTD|nr:pyruvate, phosphate dikinase [Desulfurobacterium thermolithotrophum]ADY74015.1 pyruvate, phosphate dikinase [Desulfurobacterium thermolithotrophum DSM 11699]
MSKKMVYYFGGGKAEGKADMKLLLGGKGANLAEMTNLGLPVPPGITITTEVCKEYFEKGCQFPEGMWKQVLEGLAKIEEEIGKKFGSKENPLLVSVRSGAPVSMPGMMDTILNLGLNDETVKGLANSTGNERFAWDSYRRFIQMFGNVVMGIPHDKFEALLEKKKEEVGAEADVDLTAEDLKDLVKQYKELVKKETGKNFPQDPYEQLRMAIKAVFDSWNNPRAIKYREINNIPKDYGTAVNIVAMVFGNMGETSGTGVAFTRNPSTGENVFYGEYLKNAQGEDVVAGIRTPQPLTKVQKTSSDQTSLEEEFPEVYKQLEKIREVLEKHYRDMQDIEFTIENGRLWMLQTRTGKRTARAAVKIAVDMVKEGLISKEEAILRVDPLMINQLLHPMIDEEDRKKAIAEGRLITKGLPAAPGAVSGMVVFSADEAVELAEKGKKVILVRHETSPEDIHGMHAAQGILTSRGGMTSHAAVVARGMGKTCIVGAESIHVDYENEEFRVGDVVVKKGDVITIDGATGEVFLGEIKTIPAQISGEFKELMKWADEIRDLQVRVNADTPEDAKQGREFGAEGIGLCRTEHMFFKEERIPVVREMILAKTEEERKRALSKLLPMQREDFIAIFKVMNGLPVNIRLLDPPLHEFLPRTEEEFERTAKEMGLPVEEIKRRAEELHEVNPMLGLRGSRLGIAYPEIYEMQARAILEAACYCKKEGIEVLPEIMLPLIADDKELEELKKLIDKVAEEVFNEIGIKVQYQVGTMVEVPRAALIADQLAKYAEYFSFGTNDLTQMTFGLSRDDSGKFIGKYVELGILKGDPFMHIDENGVGQLIKLAVEKGNKVRPNMKTGICGEHGGDPRSINFFQKVGVKYVSPSPFRVPIARLAAAQAKIRQMRGEL